MLEIRFGDDRKVLLDGRLDASQAAAVQAFLDQVDPPCVIDAAGLEYISSAGLGVLLKTHKRLMSAGSALHIVNINVHVKDIFRYSGLDKLFTITDAPTDG